MEEYYQYLQYKSAENLYVPIQIRCIYWSTAFSAEPRKEFFSEFLMSEISSPFSFGGFDLYSQRRPWKTGGFLLLCIVNSTLRKLWEMRSCYESFA